MSAKLETERLVLPSLGGRHLSQILEIWTHPDVRRHLWDDKVIGEERAGIEIARSKEMIIYAGSINRDHVYMLIGIPPNSSVSKAVQYLKGKSSHKPLSEYGTLRKRYWANICGREGIG